MELPRNDVDAGGLLEYSVVFTDRAVNHMSQRFCHGMQRLLDILRTTYAADTAVVIPGGGTYAMEAVARHFFTDKRTLIVRNGFFSYRWSQINAAARLTDTEAVICARQEVNEATAAFTPPSIEEVTAAIRANRSEVVCAAHVETAAGMLLSDDYLREVAAATHEVGGIFILDCIASGPLWVDMEDIGVDVLISAPQKGWSGSPTAGYVMLNARARRAVADSTGSSFALDLRTWMDIADAYVGGSHAYHATMPTDTLLANVRAMEETLNLGLDQARERQWELGNGIRQVCEQAGFTSVAAPPWQAPTVAVMYCPDPTIVAAYADVGVQVAAGVPLKVGEREDYSAFRLGLFGLDKLTDVPAAIARLRRATAQLPASVTPH
ncbi:MAG: aminotransferase class V-fold PLP-dependent enzyme [Bowdeniella nasicola]|nr:aminotransferase class V-fold PLP-dependent enzyme [Bowdeniella nasicola]